MAKKRRAAKATLKRAKGWPKKPPGKKQTLVIQPKFTPAEHAAIEAVAKRSGMALATWARVKLLEVAGLAGDDQQGGAAA